MTNISYYLLLKNRNNPQHYFAAKKYYTQLSLSTKIMLLLFIRGLKRELPFLKEVLLTMYRTVYFL